MTGVFARWKVGEERLVTITPPLRADHPLAGQPCLVCGANLFGGVSDPRDVALLALGVEPAEHKRGDVAARWYSAVALPLHAGCARPGYVEGSGYPQPEIEDPAP